VEARSHLAAADAARLVAHLRTFTEGNPFFAGELLRTLEEEGTLAPTAPGNWHLGELRVPGVPPLVQQVIDARLARLGDEAVRLLGIAAVIGPVVPFDLWATVAEVPEDALLDAIERAVEARVLVESTADGGYRFAHALIRGVLYQGILLPRRRAWHRRSGEILATTASPDPDRVAHHFRQANDPRAAEWLIKAGELARRSYAWLMAAERYEAALRLGENGGLDRERRIALLLTLTQLRRYDDPSRGIGYAEEAAQLATGAGDTGLAAAALFDQGHLRCNVNDYRRGLAQMEEALPILEALSPPEQARMRTLGLLGVAFEEGRRGVLVQWLANVGRYHGALTLGESQLAGTAGLTLRVVVGLGNVYAALGMLEAARQSFAHVHGELRAAGQYFQVALTLRQELSYVAIPYYADRVAERQRLADAAEEALAHGRGMHDTQTLRAMRLSLLILEGEWAEARHLALRADDTTSDGGFWQRRVRHEIGALFRAQGDADLAWRLVHEALPEGQNTAPGNAIFRSATAMQGLAAALALDVGDLSSAQAWLATQDRWLEWSGSVHGRAESQLGWCTFHRTAGNFAQAVAHAQQALLQAAEPRQPLALLAAHRLLGELDTATGSHADATNHLAAALALADACAAPYERALTMLSLVQLRLVTGDCAAAASALDEARALLEPLQARPALARADTLATKLAAADSQPAASSLPAGLSAREAEVLRLVAGGLSNAQAAGRLYLSPRTIDQHLRSIYNKLGVENRAAATRFAIEHGLA
jgi:DNA-binding CsgD family transcriptional regulator